MAGIKLEINLNNGSLASQIVENKRNMVSELVLKGHITEEDMIIISNMCNTLDENGERTGGVLETLDIKSCYTHIKDWECNEDNSSYKYSIIDGNILLHLNNCISLRNLKLNINTQFNGDANYFKGCKNLESIEPYEDGYGSRFFLQHSYSYGAKSEFNKFLPYLHTDGGVLYSVQNINNADHWRLVRVPQNHTQDVKICSISFGGNLEIAPWAFEGCNIKTFEVSSIAPKVVQESMIGLENATILVPKNAFNNYFFHPIWGNMNLKDIEEWYNF